MINDSVRYKAYIKKETLKIKSLFLKNKSIDSAKKYFEFEKFLFESAFLIRKLIESKKISDELENERLEINYAEVKDRDAVLDVFHKNEFDLNYDFRKLKKSSLKIGEITNIFIHSYIFALVIDEADSNNTLSIVDLIITSDWKKDRIYSIKLVDYLNMCSLVCKDNIVALFYLRKPGDKFRSIVKKSRISQ